MKANLLHAQFLQAVLNFFPKQFQLCSGILCPQKHFECFPSLEHSDFFSSFQQVISNKMRTYIHFALNRINRMVIFTVNHLPSSNCESEPTIQLITYCLTPSSTISQLAPIQLNISKYYISVGYSLNIENQKIREFMILSLAELKQILKGFRNGLEYGSKVRFVHSLVMALLFRSITKKEIANIFKMAFEHGKNLGLFVLSYKASYKIMDNLFGKKQIHHFVAGFVFGGLIFGRKTNVNYQIVLYLLSRVIVALVEKFYKQSFTERWNQTILPLPFERRYGYLIFAALCWGVVMWLFEVDKSTLQPGLKSSMQFLYVDSQKPLKSMYDVIPFYPKDKEQMQAHELKVHPPKQHHHHQNRAQKPKDEQSGIKNHRQ